MTKVMINFIIYLYSYSYMNSTHILFLQFITQNNTQLNTPNNPYP